MTGRLDLYRGVFVIRFVAGMQYRAAAWAGALTQFFWGGMNLMVFHAFYRSGGTAPMPFDQLSDYVWLKQAALAMTMLWMVDNSLLEDIVSGHVSYELCRPHSLYPYWFARLLAGRASSTALRCWPILLVAFLLPEPYRLHPPRSVEGLLLFVISMALGGLLTVAVSMFVYLLTLVSLSPHGPRLLIGSAAEFLMGALIPIPFMPKGLQRALQWLPFRYIIDLPFRVYSGGITGGEAWSGILIQLAWTVGLVCLGGACFRRTEGRIVVQGG